ncbi:MAG: pentapeptide repeat-containing protein [Verrucomicrobiota bacterium]
MLTPNNRIRIEDQKIEADLEKQAFVNHLFVRLVAKEKRFTKVDFRYSIFETCYLRGCVFDSCDFTGCRFVGTSLYGSSFDGCKFDYALFEKTIVDSDLLNTSCPGPENLKMRFARTLRMNFQQLGDAQAANRAIEVELAATEIHLKKAWNANESYYRKKYKGWTRIKMLFEWVGFKVLDWVWGNGESPLKLLRSVALILAAIALVDATRFMDPSKLSSYWLGLLRAPQIFLGTLTPSGYPGLYLALIVAVRLIAFGLFMSIVIKRMNRR